ncbi:MAG: hypothetical protein R6U40_07640 [Desulfobacterales bacterium]
MKIRKSMMCWIPILFLLWVTSPADSRYESLADNVAITQHSVQINGQSVKYTATAGTMPIIEDGKVMASMFYVAYTRDGVKNPKSRPIVFSFNGGPGAASVWMHMGYTGPRRVLYDEEGFALQPPGKFVNNEHSIIDLADIVFIDPIATGFSRMAPEKDPHHFHGLIDDIRSVAEFIRLYVTRNGRWGSPKFIIGESYGTTRAAGLAGYLQRNHRMYLNGVILVSMTGLNAPERGTLLSEALVLPHYTATAWYHGRLSQDLQQRPLREVLDEAEAFAINEYLRALALGHDLPEEERVMVAKKTGRYLGLSQDYVERSNLRIDRNRFRKELLRNKRLTVGRLDSRYTGIDKDAAGEAYEYDPAMADWSGTFTTAINRYFLEELKYETDLEYHISGNVRPWRRDPGVNVGEMLRSAMNQNPYLKVMVQAGYYDGATDYFSAIFFINQLQPGGELKDRFQFAFYECGHMMYLRQADLAKAKQDLSEFIRWALED